MLVSSKLKPSAYDRHPISEASNGILGVSFDMRQMMGYFDPHPQAAAVGIDLFLIFMAAR
jgi:hypothetical protein